MRTVCYRKVHGVMCRNVVATGAVVRLLKKGGDPGWSIML